MNIFKLALRNVLRNRHRTLVTTLAMAFAGFIMILFAALMNGMLEASERNVVVMDVSDIQIHAQGYRDDPDLYKRITNPNEIIARLKKAGFLAAPRLYSFALAASGSTSAGVQLRGVDVVHEQQVTEIHRHIMIGQWLSEDTPFGVVIGKKLARTLGVDVGDEVVIVGQAADGAMANDLYHVRGVLKSVGVEIDSGGFFMVEAAFRELIVLPEGSHEIVIMRPDRTRDLQEAMNEVSHLVDGQVGEHIGDQIGDLEGGRPGAYEVLSWRQLRPVIARILDMGDAQLFVMILIVYIAVATVVFNAMLMSVLERIREFGIMKAIGVTPWQLVALIYVEALIQAMFASLLALVTGWLAADYFQDHGIDFSETASSVSFSGVALDPIWYASVTVDAILTPVVFLWVMTILAVIYPAVKAAVITPVNAIHDR